MLQRFSKTLGFIRKLRASEKEAFKFETESDERGQLDLICKPMELSNENEATVFLEVEHADEHTQTEYGEA